LAISIGNTASRQRKFFGGDFMSSFAKQKFYEAIFSLVGDGALEMRLTYAASELGAIQASNLPASIRIDFAALMRELTSKPLSNDAGFIPRNVDRVEGNRLAQTILRMYAELSGNV
jgi:hypothetical protein